LTRPDDLLAAINAADPTDCARLLRDLEEKTRRALHPIVALRVEELARELRDFTKPSRKESFERYSVARLALLGVATLAELNKLPSWSFPKGEETAAVVLANRRPAWLVAWAEFELPRNVRNWSTVRALVRSGSIPPPATEFYILGMIAAPSHGTSPRQLLEQDPALLSRELWRLFDCGGTGELSLAAYDKYVHQSKSWLDAFLTMSADGTIDRSLVLTGTLDALQRDFAPFRAGWFSRLHEALKPSRDERVRLCDRYLDLLSSRVPATVSFAMKALVETHKAGTPGTVIALDRLAPAFEARDKGTVERALALAAKISQASGPAAQAHAASLAARALGHESPEIQTAALKLVRSESALIAPYLALLAPSVRASLGAVERAATLVEFSECSAVSGTALRVEPIASLNELVETFAAVVENQGPPVEIERVIDGVARIGISATDEMRFERLTAGVAKRAEKLLARGGVPQPRAALAALALAWTRRVRIPAPKSEDNLADFLVWRLWCASEQAAQRLEQRLLSLPTSPDGRIEPGEFDLRLAALTDGQRKAAERDSESLFHLDFLLGRLRATGGALPIRMRLVWKKRSWEVQGRTYCYYQPLLETEGLPKPSRFDPAGLTTAHFGATLEMKRWCATVNPHWSEGWFAAGCRDLGSNLDWWQANWSTRAYLEPLLNPQTRPGAMGALLIALGLGAKEAGERGLATDALIAATSDSRLEAAAFGRALSEAAASGALKFARWAKQMHKAAQAGPVQARAIFLAIEVFFESAYDAKADAFGLMVELEYELAHLTGLTLQNPASLRTLAALNIGGKTGRAANKLLKQSSAPD
jgi:Family of unknown function (DUF6493)